MKDIKKTDVEIWDQLRFDITTLQLFSVDEESFNVAYKLLERKYVQIEVDKELMTILREFFRYFSDECIICTLKKAWFQSANPLGPSTNNSLERINRTFKVTTFSYDFILLRFILFLRFWPLEKLEEEDVPMARMVEAEKLLNENEHYISYKDVATGHKFIIKKDYGIKRGVVTKVFVMPYRMTPDIDPYSFLKKSGNIIIHS